MHFLPPAYVVRGKVIFILGNVCLFTIGRGGYPIPGLDGGGEGGYPIPGLMVRVGGTPSQVWMVGGYPIPGLMVGGYPGYPPP